MSKLKSEVIKYSKKLNITNLSALRSGNISARAKEKGVDGFYTVSYTHLTLPTIYSV